jgi:hypothetical protein
MSAQVTSVSPYAAAKIANAALLEAGVNKVLPAQMFYNYTTARIRAGKASLIPTVEVGGKVEITLEGLTAWLGKYLPKQGVELAEEGAEVTVAQA